MELIPLIPLPIHLIIALAFTGTAGFALGQSIGNRIAYRLGLA